MNKIKNIETNYINGAWFTVCGQIFTIMDIRRDINGLNEYLLYDGEDANWVTGIFIKRCEEELEIE